jgi:hypothetical protein
MWHLLPHHPARSAGSGMIGVNWNDGHGLLWPDGGGTLSAYLCTCLPGHQQKSTKSKEEAEATILKKKFLGVLMRIYVAVYFLNESQP